MKSKKDIIKFSAGGLRDFSRIAASNEIMWRDIFFSNKKNVVSAINLLQIRNKKLIYMHNDYCLVTHFNIYA